MISNSLERKLADAQVYVALRRLETQGLISTRSSKESTVPPKRTRGRPRKFYTLSASGKGALESAGAILSSSAVGQRSPQGGRFHDTETTTEGNPALVG